jgi:hypothetical protein
MPGGPLKPGFGLSGISNLGASIINLQLFRNGWLAHSSPVFGLSGISNLWGSIFNHQSSIIN